MDRDHSNNSSRPNTSPAGIIPDSQQGSPESGVAARIQASATGLVRQAILRPSASSATEDLASSAADAGKGGSGSSSARPSQFTVSSMSSHEPSPSFRDSTDSAGRSDGSESFRSQPQFMENAQNGDRFDFEDFMSQGSWPSSAGNPLGADRGEDLTSDKEKLVLQPHLSSANIQANSAIQSCLIDHPAPMGRVFANNETDGTAVVALLLDPTFPMDEEPIDVFAFGSESVPKNKTQSVQANIQTAAPLNHVSTITPLDLLPDFRRPENDANATRSADLRTAMLNLPEGYLYDGSQRQLNDGDIQPWLDMLNRYQDEVWGDMLPLVREAREEAKAAKEQIPHDQPATRRLRMLLKHLEQSTNRKARF